MYVQLWKLWLCRSLLDMHGAQLWLVYAHSAVHLCRAGKVMVLEALLKAIRNTEPTDKASLRASAGRSLHTLYATLAYAQTARALNVHVECSALSHARASLTNLICCCLPLTGRTCVQLHAGA